MGEAYICRRGVSGAGKSEIIVTAPAGSTVTATLGDKVKTATEKAGKWVFKNCDLGTWVIEAKLNGQTATKSVEIAKDGQLVRYYVTMAYWQATINVSYWEGAVCTCSNEDTVLTAPDTSGSHAFVVDHPGDWVITATNDDGPLSETVSVTDQNGANYTTSLCYLYKAGNEAASITGGWKFSGFDTSYWNPASGSKESSGLRLTAKNDGKDCGMFSTVNKINAAKYKNITFSISGMTTTKQTDVHVGIYGSISDNPSNIAINKLKSYGDAPISGGRTVTVDISNVASSGYIGFFLSDQADGGGWSAEVFVTKVLLEA